MSFTAIERETVIHCDDETKTWEIYTLQPTIITKLKKAGIEPYKVDKDGGHFYKDLNFNQVSFRSGKKREVSEEQRRKAAERLRRAREKKGDIK